MRAVGYTSFDSVDQRALFILIIMVAGSMFTQDQLRDTRFLSSAYKLSDLPADQGAEVAFAGRSNAGKSSALNAITGRRMLARTSKTPGRTQLINFFDIDDEHRLVDLPGYGYAKVPDSLRRHWGHTLRDYLSARLALRGLILLMDVRHPLTDLDRQMLAWSRSRVLPVHILLTKADKISRGKAAAVLQQVVRDLSQQGGEATVQLFSAPRGLGLAEVMAVLEAWLSASDYSAHP